MPHPADLVLDANYRGPFAADAEYFAPGIPLVAGQGLACRVMRGGQQAGLDIGGVMARPVTDTDTLKVRVREVARPLRSGVFHLREERAFYRLTAEAECFDRHRREWTCETLRLADIVIPPPFAAITGRGRAGGAVRGVHIDAAATGRGRAGTISFVQILSAPAIATGRAGGLVRAVSLDAPARGRGRASAALESAGLILINAPAIGAGIAGGVLRATFVDAAARARGEAGGVSRAIFIDAPASGRGRAFAALEAQGNIQINAPATGRGVSGAPVRGGQIAAPASAAAASGSVQRGAAIDAPAIGAGAAGTPQRASPVNAPATGRGRAGAGLELAGAIEINAPAIGRGASGSVARGAVIDGPATGTAASGGVRRDVALDAPAVATGAAGTAARNVPLDAAAAATGNAGGLQRGAEIDAPASGAGAASAPLARDTVIDGAAAGTGSASADLARASDVTSPASGQGISGAPVRGVRLDAIAAGSGASGAVRRTGLINAPASGAGVAGTVVGEDGASEPPARTAPSFRSVSTSLGNATISRPAGTAAGDVLIAMVFDFEASGTVTIPSDWHALGSTYNVSSGLTPLYARMAYRVATGSEPTSYSFSTSPEDFPGGYILCYQGADVSDPVSGFAYNSGGAATRTIPDVSADFAGSRLVAASFGHDGGGITSTPSGMTQRASVIGFSAVYDEAIADAGATGTRTHTQTNGAGASWLTASVIVNGTPA